MSRRVEDPRHTTSVQFTGETWGRKSRHFSPLVTQVERDSITFELTPLTVSFISHFPLTKISYVSLGTPTRNIEPSWYFLLFIICWKRNKLVDRRP